MRVLDWENNDGDAFAGMLTKYDESPYSNLKGSIFHDGEQIKKANDRILTQVDKDLCARKYITKTTNKFRLGLWCKRDDGI